MQYVYPAVFYKDKKMPDTWSVVFPDVDGAATYGNSLYEAMEMAEDALAGIMAMYEDFKAGKSDLPMNNRIVDPTPIEKVIAEPDEYSEKAFVTLIKTDTDIYRKILAEMPQRNETDEEDDDREIPEKYASEVFKVAGIEMQ